MSEKETRQIQKYDQMAIGIRPLSREFDLAFAKEELNPLIARELKILKEQFLFMLCGTKPKLFVKLSPGFLGRFKLSLCGDINRLSLKSGEHFSEIEYY